MDPNRFDQLARVFARDVSRRTAVRRLGASLATAAVATGVPVGRALAQDPTAAAQDGDEEPEGPVDEIPADAEPLGGCPPRFLGCRDFDGDGICRRTFIDATCEIVETEECTCPGAPQRCTCQRICTAASGAITTTEIPCGTISESDLETQGPDCCTDCNLICDECALFPPRLCRACLFCFRTCSLNC
jgi:hypothetical protein